MRSAPKLFDHVVEDIARAGAQLTALGACAGSSGNISVFTTAPLECPLERVGDVDLPVPAPSLGGGWIVMTASGRRLRDVAGAPEDAVVALGVHPSGEAASLLAAPGLRPSTEWNSHVAVHADQRARRGVETHAIVHAQPHHLVFLSHLPDLTTSEQLTQRLMRWEAETAMIAPDGVERVPFHVPGSPELMAATVAALSRTAAVVWAKHGIVTRSDASARAAADVVEYLESAARFEYMNLVAGSPAHGLAPDERDAVARAFMS